jgi:shikimate dehydrogenase
MPVSKPRTFLHGLVGVFGFPVAENPTQAMIEPAFADLGLDWRYLTVEVRPEALRDAVCGARAMGWKGFNCTIPHKVAVLEHLDRLTPTAQAIGAVNFVVIQDGTLTGDNTDGRGFLEALKAVRPISDLRVVLLGAGGAARAIGFELAMAGAGRLTIVNRSQARGEPLARAIQERTAVPTSYVPWEGDYTIPSDTDVLVNATSIGLYPDVDARVPVSMPSLRAGMIVCDVIPNPPLTRLVGEAKGRGCIVLDGLGMLVNQGVIGIRLWSGADPNPSIMRRALESILNA